MISVSESNGTWKNYDWWCFFLSLVVSPESSCYCNAVMQKSNWICIIVLATYDAHLSGTPLTCLQIIAGHVETLVWNEMSANCVLETHILWTLGVFLDILWTFFDFSGRSRIICRHSACLDKPPDNCLGEGHVLDLTRTNDTKFVLLFSPVALEQRLQEGQSLLKRGLDFETCTYEFWTISSICDPFFNFLLPNQPTDQMPKQRQN
jgi:hypothetical protein